MADNPTREAALKSLKITLIADWQRVTSVDELLDLIIADRSSDHYQYIFWQQMTKTVEDMNKRAQEEKDEARGSGNV